MFAKRTENETEALEVKQFLEKSIEFKKMKTIAAKSHMVDFRAFLGRLENCKSFNELIYQCDEKYNIGNNDNIVIYNMGRNNVNAMLYVGGFFSDKSNYHYYGLHFYESIFQHLDIRKQISQQNRY